ncbi:unnamed protein product [Closterium sp. NIES-64]|nr:unnamed protein product [Closterium sp. NIES-64]
MGSSSLFWQQCCRWCFQPFSTFSPHLLTAAGIVSAITTMASHGVPVMRSFGLLLAALAALMLSACAPRAAAIRLPAASNAADRKSTA